MSLILDGTNGVSDIDGSASTPAIRGTDTNTGIFFPAADTIAFGEGGTEVMRINSSGNVGIGTSSPSTLLQIYNSTAATLAVEGDSGATVRVSRYSSDATSGTVQHRKARGTFASPTAVNSGDAVGLLNFSAFGGTNYRSVGSVQAVVDTYTSDTNISGYLTFQTNGGSTSTTERARITSGGSFLVGATSSFATAGVTSTHGFVSPTNGNWVAGFKSTTSATPWGLAVEYSAASPNDTSSNFLYCYDTSINRMNVRSNGGIANYSANNVNLSDRREKTNFAPAKNYLDTICAIPVQTFNYIDQNNEDDPGLTLGVVAQDVQDVAPEFVMESNWGTPDNPKMRLSIYQTDLQYALMKCIQELKAELDTTKARLAALEGV